MYKIINGHIIIYDKTQFNPKHILECGQIFRYKIVDNEYIVYSDCHKAIITEESNHYIIKTDSLAYFVQFFDLDTDYNAIKNTLKKEDVLFSAIDFGSGIRILKNSLLEIIISFIISANNNIPRIQKSIEYICTHLGTSKGDYYTFPTIKQLHSVNEQFFIDAGTGYRSKYLLDTIENIFNGRFDLDYLRTLPTNQARDYLITFKGIGTKVADCILLFGMHRKDVFPVDTWINKIYNETLSQTPCNNRALIAKQLVTRFGEYSGYAQQYLFYYRRSSNI